MKNKTHKTQETFGIPKGYFEQFPDRMMDRIREEGPSRRRHIMFGDRRTLGLAIAAAVVGLALISLPLLRQGQGNEYPLDAYAEIALLEDSYFFNDDLEIASAVVEDEEVDDDDAYLDHAIEFLAMDDLEMDLYYD